MLENTFLSLWSLLEILTGTDKGDILIRRILYGIKQNHREACQWELRHLHIYRNRYVHQGKTRPDIERLVYQLKMYVDVMLRCWLFQFGKLEDEQVLFSLLDTPLDSQGIAKRMRILKHALENARKAGR